MYTKSSTLKIELSKNAGKGESPASGLQQEDIYKHQQAEIEKQQQLFHIMQNNNFMAQQHQSPTHFFASLLQCPAVLGNPELMASVAGMLQSSLTVQPAVQVSPANSQANVSVQAPQFPSNGGCFRNFSIPNSDASSKLAASVANSSVCSHSSNGRSPSTTSSNANSEKNSVASVANSSGQFSVVTSSDNESTHDGHVDITNFANSNELVINKVMTVIEEILANENIQKNNFLAKLFEDQTKENVLRPQILVKRVAGFKRVKAITTEFKVVQSAMSKSKMFDLADDGLSAFRSMPLPVLGSAHNSLRIVSQTSTIDANNTLDHQTETMSLITSSKVSNLNSNGSESNSNKEQKVVKKILAINFLPEEFSIERMTTIFEKIGEIAQIVLVRPNKKIPEFLSDYIQWVPDLGSKPCAIIDFENQEAAQNACREINMSNREGSAIRCALLKPGARIKRTLYRKYTSSSTTSDEIDSSEQTHIKDTNQRQVSVSSSESSVPAKGSKLVLTESEERKRILRSKTTSGQSSVTSSRENSQDSGINHNAGAVQKQTNFNRKNVKKAISKHFISLGAWKNSTSASDQLLFGNEAGKDFCSFLRQPKGPTSNGNGFGMSRTEIC